MSSPTRQNILLTGATGYIGGSVLARLISHLKAHTFAITAIVRSPVKAEKLKALGVDVVVGSHTDEALVEKLASVADIIIAAADADNLDAAKAALRGLKKRFEETKVPGIYIHTSGTGVLSDGAKGDSSTDLIYDDLNADQIEALPPTQLHRDVDLELINADKTGYVKSYIVFPSAVYGIAKNRLTDLGIAHTRSILVPSLIEMSLSRGQGGVVGKGLNVWPNVDIEELGDLYIHLFEGILSEHPAAKHGREGIYFAENGEHSIYQVSKAIGDSLVEQGLLENPEPNVLTQEDIDIYFGGYQVLGTNSRCKGNRSRAIGWAPVKTTNDLLESIKPEITRHLQERVQKV